MTFDIEVRVNMRKSKKTNDYRQLWMMEWHDQHTRTTFIPFSRASRHTSLRKVGSGPANRVFPIDISQTSGTSSCRLLCMYSSQQTLRSRSGKANITSFTPKCNKAINIIQTLYSSAVEPFARDLQHPGTDPLFEWSFIFHFTSLPQEGSGPFSSRSSVQWS